MWVERAGTGARLPQRARRELLESAARQAFAEHGFGGTTLRDIASRAGVTTPILYRFFDSKFELYRTVVEDAAGTLMGSGPR